MSSSSTDFPLLMEHELCDITITTWKVCRFIKNFDHLTADVLNVIIHWINQTLDGSFIMRTIDLYILKAFDKVWHSGLLHRFSGRIYAIIKSFFSECCWIVNSLKPWDQCRHSPGLYLSLWSYPFSAFLLICIHH